MRPLLFIACLLMASHSAQTLADTLRIPVSQQGSRLNHTLPQHGKTTQQVLGQFGEPVKRYTTVGHPPISRWDYPDFTVYFEYNHVINSVQHHQPAKQQP